MARVNELSYRVAIGVAQCHECEKHILSGERYALYSEVTVKIAAVQFTTHRCRRLAYCEGCAGLLQDSLTTTGDIR